MFTHPFFPSVYTYVGAKRKYSKLFSSMQRKITHLSVVDKLTNFRISGKRNMQKQMICFDIEKPSKSCCSPPSPNLFY